MMMKLIGMKKKVFLVKFLVYEDLYLLQILQKRMNTAVTHNFPTNLRRILHLSHALFSI